MHQTCPSGFEANVPLPFCDRIFVRLVIGRDGHGSPQIATKGHMSTKKKFAHSVMHYIFVVNAAFGAFCAAYLIKSLLGINLLSGPSQFHPLYVALINALK